MALVGSPFPASAAAITFGFSGTVGSIVEGGSGTAPALIGQAFSGTFTFESTTLDSDSDPIYGLYLGALSAFSYEIGSNSYLLLGSGSPPFNQIEVAGGYAFYNAILEGPDVLQGSSVHNAGISLALSYLTTQPFGQLLGSTPPPLPAYGNALSLVINETPSDGFSITGELNSLYLVPEPSTAMLLAGGLICLALRRRASRV
jgi:hypothetical protein